MQKLNWRLGLRRTLKATSFVLVLKGAVGGSVALLAVFGVAVPIIGPFFGIHASPTPLTGGIVASVGAVLGALAAAKA